MKKTDWAAIILIVALVGVASFLIVGQVMPSPKDNLQSTPVVTNISETVAEPSSRIFTDDSINPTVRTTIGDQGGQQPFRLGDD